MNPVFKYPRHNPISKVNSVEDAVGSRDWNEIEIRWDYVRIP